MSRRGPDPTEEDVDRAVAAQQRLGETGLRHAGDEAGRCGSCRHYLAPDAPIAYCWHPTHRCLVGADWTCDLHVPDPDR